MKKSSPWLHDDADIYLTSTCDVNFALNARKLFDHEFGRGFNHSTVARLKASVGLFRHSTDVSSFDDSVLENFFLLLKNSGIDNLYAIPTGYHHSADNEKSMEVKDYDPPLIGKIIPQFEQYSKIRGGQIGIFSGRHYLFSPCLNYAMLDVNGYYSLIMGPREEIQKILGITIEDSWAPVWSEGSVDPFVAKELREAAAAFSANDPLA